MVLLRRIITDLHLDLHKGDERIGRHSFFNIFIEHITNYSKTFHFYSVTPYNDNTASSSTKKHTASKEPEFRPKPTQVIRIHIVKIPLS